MEIIIHNAKLQKVAFIDDELQDTLSFYNDKWSRYLSTASSTFQFTVFKKDIKSDTVKNKAYRTLNERSFVSFEYHKKTYLFTVIKTIEKEFEIEVFGENLNLELINEMAAPYKATTEMSFVDYCNKFFLLKGGAITIGRNDIGDRARTLEWTGTDTKLKRLLSIANKFDAEIEFEVHLKNDSSIKSFVMNVYKRNDGKKIQGVGKRRDDVILYYGDNIDGVTRTIDKSNIFNMITPVGKATVDVTVTKPNPKYIAPNLGTVVYSGGSLSNGGRTISKDLVNEILNLCVQHKLLPSGVFSQLYLESWWGNSPVARADNNWGGLTWTGNGNRPSGVKVTQGTARPANEGGYYMHFANLSDYFKDYTYLLAEQGIYKVKGANNIDSYTKGLFRVGGATYDYAAAGYAHYAPLMRSIRAGINGASNGAMDTLDNQFKTAGTVGTAPVSQVATKTKSVLEALTAKKGQLIGSGQCYAVSAWYAQSIGGPGLGGGVTGLRGLIGAGAAASQIGEDYNWSQFGWKVVRPSEVKHLIPGSIANIRANVGGPVFTGGWGHTVVIKSLSGDTLTVLEQNFAGHQYVEERTYSASAYLSIIQTLCYPPEVVQGKRVDGTEQAPAQNGGNNEPQTTSETQQKEVITRIPDDLYREWKNEDGVVEFYLKNGSIYAPISKDLYPSVFSGEEVTDNWIKKSVEYETIDVEKLISYSLEELKKNCYPSVTYEIDGYVDDLELGDTIQINDEEFPDGLFLEARVTEQHISFTEPSQNKTVFDNFKALENKVSESLRNRSEELLEQAKPYELRLLTDNGTQFRNSTGLSVLTAELWKSNKKYDATFQFRNGDTLLASGLQYTVDGSKIEADKPFLVSIDAFIGNDLVATRQITFNNVNDGAVGPQGPKGEDGIAGKDGVGVKSTVITYGLSANESTQPTTWTSTVPTLVKGQYLWTKTVWTYSDSTNETGYTKTYIAKDGNNGSDGIAGKDGVGIKTTTITYQASSSGITPPTGTWTSQVPSVPNGHFLWTRTVWTYTDNTSETGYSVAKMGETGPQGPVGADGKSSYTHIAYATNSTGTSGFSVSDNVGKTYIGMYVDQIATDSTDPSKYKWNLIKGSDGAQGIAGPPGADGKTPYWHTAYANSVDGKTDFSLTDSSNKRFIGQYTDYTQADSTDPTKYKWVDMTANVKVGGVNLLKGTSSEWKNVGVSQYAGFIKTLTPTDLPNLKVGDFLAFSFDVNTSSNKKLRARLSFSGANKHYFSNDYVMSGTGRVSVTGQVPAGWTDLILYVDANLTATTITTITTEQYKRAKLELGNVATDYSEAPEDTQLKIDSKSDQALTQAQQNALSEQLAIAKAELQAKASIDTLNQWITSYQNYVTSNNADSQQAKADLIAWSQKVEALGTQMGEVKETKIFMDRYFSQSSEGLVIGQTDGTSNILIKEDRISMFSSGNEVMYISQGVLNINNGIFALSIQLGRFREEQYAGNKDINVIRYVGGV
ncbi:phage protein [Streptococcus pseudoporcinus]|uniref:Phage protein n=1 Tax=Streptococcus pseudoporcinus TaxID=361101 RepID=A0A4U9XP08_9STRE|nr:glucosaminidase domain-containing protein [Streptococcus pseudoporcinus]VTS14191.1 phage protein [Streptococcus pseudoporcinus]